jgi:ribonuclease G
LRRELLISAGPGEWRAAWLENGTAAELYIERGDIRPAGSIHLGRIVRRVGGLGAVLVAIGEERPGFLPMRPGAVGLDEGARIVVQVRREAQRDKGALLSARLAAPAEPAVLAARAEKLDPPAQLMPAAGFAGALALRMPGVPECISVDDVAALPDVRDNFPGVDVQHVLSGDWRLDIGAVFEAALAPTVALAGGGTIHLEEGRAAVLIDVDTGTPDAGSVERTALATNLAAAAAVAREVRLRQLGGGIVVDFAALEGRRVRERLRHAMELALAGDPAQPQVLGWTRLGHLEIVRPRRGRPLSAAMLEPRAARKNAAALAFEALRAVYREARARPSANWRLVVAPAVAAALYGPAAAGLRVLEARLGRRIGVVPAPSGDAPPFDIAPM